MTCRRISFDREFVRQQRSSDADHIIPVGSQRPDETDSHDPHGHFSNEGSSERPGNVGRLAILAGQVLRLDARVEENMARVYRQDSRQTGLLRRDTPQEEMS